MLDLLFESALLCLIIGFLGLAVRFGHTIVRPFKDVFKMKLLGSQIPVALGFSPRINKEDAICHRLTEMQQGNACHLWHSVLNKDIF